MRAAIFRNGDFVVDDIKDPTPSEGQVLVKSLCCGICAPARTGSTAPNGWSASVLPAASWYGSLALWLSVANGSRCGNRPVGTAKNPLSGFI